MVSPLASLLSTAPIAGLAAGPRIAADGAMPADFLSLVASVAEGEAALLPGTAIDLARQPVAAPGIDLPGPAPTPPSATLVLPAAAIADPASAAALTFPPSRPMATPPAAAIADPGSAAALTFPPLRPAATLPAAAITLPTQASLATHVTPSLPPAWGSNAIALPVAEPRSPVDHETAPAPAPGKPDADASGSSAPTSPTIPLAIASSTTEPRISTPPRRAGRRDAAATAASIVSDERPIKPDRRSDTDDAASPPPPDRPVEVAAVPIAPPLAPQPVASLPDPWLDPAAIVRPECGPSTDRAMPGTDAVAIRRTTPPTPPLDARRDHILPGAVAATTAVPARAPATVRPMVPVTEVVPASLPAAVPTRAEPITPTGAPVTTPSGSPIDAEAVVSAVPSDHRQPEAARDTDPAPVPAKSADRPTTLSSRQAPSVAAAVPQPNDGPRLAERTLDHVEADPRAARGKDVPGDAATSPTDAPVTNHAAPRSVSDIPLPPLRHPAAGTITPAAYLDPTIASAPPRYERPGTATTPIQAAPALAVGVTSLPAMPVPVRENAAVPPGMTGDLPPAAPPLLPATASATDRPVAPPAIVPRADSAPRAATTAAVIEAPLTGPTGEPARKPARAEPAFRAFAAALFDAAGAAAPATPTAPAAPLADPRPLDLTQARWPHAMVDRIERLRDEASLGDTRIRLIPDALGTIDVALRRDGETVHVAFHAERAETRQLLAEARPELTALAETRGIKLADPAPAPTTGGWSNGQTGSQAFAGNDRAPRQQQQPSTPAAPPRAAIAAEEQGDDTRIA